MQTLCLKVNKTPDLDIDREANKNSKVQIAWGKLWKDHFWHSTFSENNDRTLSSKKKKKSDFKTINPLPMASGKEWEIWWWEFVYPKSSSEKQRKQSWMINHTAPHAQKAHQQWDNCNRDLLPYYQSCSANAGWPLEKNNAQRIHMWQSWGMQQKSANAKEWPGSSSRICLANSWFRKKVPNLKINKN